MGSIQKHQRTGGERLNLIKDSPSRRRITERSAAAVKRGSVPRLREVARRFAAESLSRTDWILSLPTRYPNDLIHPAVVSGAKNTEIMSSAALDRLGNELTEDAALQIDFF